ncbi:MAG: serine/threonine protein kinase [Deltaproteobacteria bacterium]|nr:MAG: serine/threonine protein kinase [Deltaproteobacteria bacterium]
MTEFFFRLTPDWVLRAVEAGGFEPTGHCSALNSLENRVYDLRLTDGSHVVAKFYRPARWTRAAILEEHRFLFDLREAEIPVCAPIVFPDGDTLHEVEGIFYAVWPRTGGRAPDELLDEQVSVLGRLVARIHNVGAARGMESRPQLSSHSHGLAPLEALEALDALPPQCRRRYRAAVEQVVSIYDELSDGVPVHRIHGDCHLGNLLHGREGYFFLDFDDCRVGPAVQDVWMLIPGRDAEAARQRDVLIDAYRQFRDFEPRWLGLVEPLRALRFVHYAAWIARRFEDPAFPDAFPHFGTVDYWERETQDLEDQLARIERGAAQPTGTGEARVREEEEVLTNKDFFWDLEDC